ncbi:MAG: hypothetical protein JWQ07_679 [Ramlibacter sp.]|nr:hypothetical protein [Ramlibacter sp.]
MPHVPLVALMAPIPSAPTPSPKIEALPGLDANGYRSHALHGPDAVWGEKNCYSDLWVELLHTLQLEPMAMLPFTLAADFEGDQWTFFKPSLGELQDLYGIDVQELTVWRPMVEHAADQLRAGKLICCEVDAYWLPDTAATDYRQKHTKTTILVASLDVEEERLGYFHNAGYFELAGEDFRGVLRAGVEEDPQFMPLFAELVRVDRMVRRPADELAALSFEMLRKHFGRRPPSNPFERFGTRVTEEFPALRSRGLPFYHAWAFANVRQAGAAFELAAEYLRWQAGFGHEGLRDASFSFDAIALGMKALILKAARAVNSGKPLQAGDLFDNIAADWDRGMKTLEQCLGQPRSVQADPSVLAQHLRVERADLEAHA